MLDAIPLISLLSTTALTSGINLYLTVAALGIAQRFHWLTLPGDLAGLGNPLVILIAIALYVINFVADKIPVFDSVWDGIHTFIRPIGGAILGYLAATNMGTEWQIPISLITGTLALNSHLTKATSRVAINSVPTGVGNSIASVSEDAFVIGLLYLVARHPIISILVVILFVLFSIWFLKKMFRFLKKVLKFIFKSESDPTDSAPKSPSEPA